MKTQMRELDQTELSQIGGGIEVAHGGDPTIPIIGGGRDWWVGNPYIPLPPGGSPKFPIPLGG